VNGGRAIGESLFRVGDGLGGFPIDFDKVDAIGCDVAVLRDDDGDGVADEVDAILSEDVVDGLARPGRSAAQTTEPTPRMSLPV
jgi:hypothetical protein